MKLPVDERGQIKLNNAGRQEIGGQWMINVGGNKHDNFSDGVQIPIYVITFGIVGGYLRYLYDATASTRRKHVDEQINKIDSNYQTNLRKLRSVEELKLENEDLKVIVKQGQDLKVFEFLRSLAFLLSPILAVAVWFVLAQLGIQGQQQNAVGQTGIFVLSAVRFTIGLVTDEAVKYLINFIRERLGMSKMDSTNDQKNKDSGNKQRMKDAKNNDKVA